MAKIPTSSIFFLLMLYLFNSYYILRASHVFTMQLWCPEETGICSTTRYAEVMGRKSYRRKNLSDIRLSKCLPDGQQPEGEIQEFQMNELYDMVCPVHDDIWKL